MYTVDYDVNNTKGRFVADLSFTFLHWNLIEKLDQGVIDPEQIDAEQV